MGAPVTLTDLPVEVLIEIFQNDGISCEDLFSIHQTCSYLREVINTRSLWTNKLRKVWPNSDNDNRPSLDPFDECKNIISTYKTFREQILISSPTFFESMSCYASHNNLKYFLEMCNTYGGLGKVYLFAFLRDIYTKDFTDQQPRARLYTVSNRYCASVVLNYLNQHFLKETWRKVCRNRQKMTPEKVAFFFARWMEPELEAFDAPFEEVMTSIVNIVKASLPKNHPLNLIEDEKRKSWSTDFILENIYEPETSKKVIKLIYEVLNEQGLMSTAEPKISNLTIRNVIERKESNSYYSPIIYEAVLRRCGIRIECLFLSGTIHLLWRGNWETDSDIYDINVFNGEIDTTTIYFMNRPNFSLYSPTEILVKLSTCMNDVDGKLTDTYQRSVKLLKFLEPNNVMHFLTR